MVVCCCIGFFLWMIYCANYINMSTTSGIFRLVCACSVFVLSCVRLLMLLLSCRTGKVGYIQIDGGATLHGQSKGRSLMVNTKGSIYLGEWSESMEFRNGVSDIV